MAHSIRMHFGNLPDPRRAPGRRRSAATGALRSNCLACSTWRLAEGQRRVRKGPAAANFSRLRRIALHRRRRATNRKRGRKGQRRNAAGDHDGLRKLRTG